MNQKPTHEQELAALQAQFAADLQRDMAKAVAKREAEAKRDLVHLERQYFLDRLVDAREKRKLTQADLAKKVRMPQSAIARIESGRGNPTLKTLLILAKALDTELRL